MNNEQTNKQNIPEKLNSLLSELKSKLNFYNQRKNIEKLTNDIKVHLDNLTKPIGSLGRLEEFVLQYCLCRQSADAVLKKPAIYVFAADHGITEEGVSLYPSDVTCQMAINMLQGGAAISVLCRNANITCRIVDIGIKSEFNPAPEITEQLIRCKVRNGSRNFLKEAAMNNFECWEALKNGYDLAVASGADILGIGEMGIGNTAAASALYALLLGLNAQETTGKGTGLNTEQLKHKQLIIEQALQLHRSGWDKTPFDALSRVGGLEIAGMAGFILGAVSHQIPVVIDGFIAGAAALVCLRWEPAITDYLFFAHQSAEQFHSSFLSILNKQPLLNLNMRLGEGTGGALAIMLIRQAMNCYHEMATFAEAGVSGRK